MTSSFITDADAYDLAEAVLARPEAQGLVTTGMEELLRALLAAGFEPSGTFPVVTGEAYRGCIQVAAVMAYDPAKRVSVEVRSILYVHTVASSRSQAQLYFEAAVHDGPRPAGSPASGRQLAQVDLHEVPPTLAAVRANWFGKDFSRAVHGVVSSFESDAASLCFRDNAQALVAALDEALAH